MADDEGVCVMGMEDCVGWLARVHGKKVSGVAERREVERDKARAVERGLARKCKQEPKKEERAEMDERDLQIMYGALCLGAVWRRG